MIFLSYRAKQKLSKLGNTHLGIRKLLLQLNKWKHHSRQAKTSPDKSDMSWGVAG